MPQAIGAVASIGGALLQGSASKKAAKAQAAAGQQDLAYQRETRDLIFNRLDPYYKGGTDAQAAYDFELGLRDRPTFGGSIPGVEAYNEPAAPGGRPVANMNTFMNGMMGMPQGTGGAAGGVQRFRVNGQSFATRAEAEAFAKANATGGQAYGGYTKTPGYDFRMKEGLNAIESSAAARGGLYSGAALQDQQKFGQDYATSEYGNHLARLSGRAGTGLGAATGIANAATNAAGGVSNALGGIGNAQAAGAVGMGNALTGGLQNLATNWNYQKNMGNNMFGGGR